MPVNNLSLLFSGVTRVLQFETSRYEYIEKAEVRCVEEANFRQDKQFILYVTFIDGSIRTTFLSSSDFGNGHLTQEQKAGYLQDLIQSNLCLFHTTYIATLQIPVIEKEFALRRNQPILRSGGQVYSTSEINRDVHAYERATNQVGQSASTQRREPQIDDLVITEIARTSGGEILLDHVTVTRGNQPVPYSPRPEEESILIAEDTRTSELRQMEERMQEEVARQTFELYGGNHLSFDTRPIQDFSIPEGYVSTDYNHAYHEVSIRRVGVDVSQSGGDYSVASVFEVKEKEPENKFDQEVKSTKRKIKFF